MFVVEMSSKGTPYDACDTPQDDQKHWIRLFQGDLRTLSASRMSAAAYSTLSELAPDIVFAGGIAYVAGATAVRWCRNKKRPVVILDNARLVDVPRSGLTNYVKRRIYRNVDAVLIPASSHNRSYQHWGFTLPQIFHGLNVIDNAWFARESEQARNEAHRLRKELDVPEHFFLAVGRQIPIKNFDTLLLAYDLYRRNASQAPWGLVLIGQGQEHETLKALISRLNIPGVHMVPFVDRSQLPRWYAMASALVLPSFAETWGSVASEAMACGVPVLLSQGCGCTQTLMREGQNGWAFLPSDTRGLSELLTRMATISPERRKQLGQASREIISQWPLDRFVTETRRAIHQCQSCRRGFHSLTDRMLLRLWKGRFRPV